MNIQAPLPLDPTSRPTLIIVSGPPGSGKTTLARLLAQAMPCPLVSRDEINEGIFHTFGHDLTRASKDSVATQANNTFFAIIQLLLTAGATVVAEAAFQDHRWRAGLTHVEAPADVRVVQCTASPDLSRERIAQRRLGREHTPSEKRAAQARQASPPALAAGSFQRLSLPGPSLDVATEDGYDPGLDQILDFISSQPA